uniref:Mitochondrial transcription rescue factor 1 n=1 Tax=Ornithorhynchus anatinus TaxID=9258 RepID=A0A6I8PPH6_ORNAN
MSSWRRLPVWTLGRFSAWIGPWGRHPPSRPWPSLSHGICSSSHQLNASTSRAPFPSLPRGSPLRPVAVSPLCPTLSSSRLKSNKSSRKARNRTLQQQEEEEDEDSPEEGDWSEQEDLLDNDPHVTRDYKDLDKVVPSLRYDAILKAGLDIARNKVEDAFYKGELRLNGEKLWKKSRTVRGFEPYPGINREANSYSPSSLRHHFPPLASLRSSRSSAEPTEGLGVPGVETHYWVSLKRPFWGH